MTQTPKLNKSPFEFTGIFSSFTLKTLACIFMLIDHIGARIFPQIALLRIIGRLAYPIFAFFIAEGCRYTRNKRKRFFTVLGLGIVCESVYICFDGKYYGNILLTFSLSILLIYALQAVKKQAVSGDLRQRVLSLLVFAGVLVGVIAYVELIGVDYGIAGVTAPLFATLFDYKEGESPAHLKKWDRLPIKLISFTVGLLLLVWQKGVFHRQTWCLLAIPLLAFYNGKPGTVKFKYGFYLFYPLHLAIVQLIAMLVRG